MNGEIIFIDEIRKEIEERKKNGTLFPPKDINYPLNRDKLDKWASYHDKCEDDDIRTFVKVIKDKTIGVSWIEFYTQFKLNIDELMPILNNDKLDWVISDAGDKRKSNYWLMLLMIDYLYGEYSIKNPNFKKPYGMVFEIASLYGGYNIIYLDDASYSGSQMSMNIGTSEINSNPAYIVIPYMTDISKYRIKNIAEGGFINGISYKRREYQILCNNRMRSVLGYMQDMLGMQLSEERLDEINIKINEKFNIGIKDKSYGIENCVPIYFDHKIADYLSSFPTIYASGKIGKCSNAQDLPQYEMFIDNCERIAERDSIDGTQLGDKCAPPFYKAFGGGMNSMTGIDISAFLLKAGAINRGDKVVYNGRKYSLQKEGNKKYIVSKGKRIFLSNIRGKYFIT
jgi:hypothetical protein